VIAHTSLFVLWGLEAVAAVGTVVGFAQGWRAGMEPLSALGILLGVTRLATNAIGAPHWPTPTAIRSLWRGLLGTPAR